MRDDLKLHFSSAFLLFMYMLMVSRALTFFFNFLIVKFMLTLLLFYSCRVNFP